MCIRAYARKCYKRRKTMLEKEVEQYFCKAVKTRLSGWPLKIISPGQNGMPDRIVLLPGGKIYFVELKAPGKKARKLQEHVHQKLHDLGFPVQLIDTREAADDFVREVQAGGI